MDSGEVKGITYYDKPDGIFFPMDQIKPEEQFIKNFVTRLFSFEIEGNVRTNLTDWEAEVKSEKDWNWVKKNESKKQTMRAKRG